MKTKFKATSTIAQLMQPYLTKLFSIQKAKHWFGGCILLVAASLPAVGYAQPGKTFHDCPDCPEMVVIPAGNTIGEPFALGKTEVTQGQWKAIMGNNPSENSNCGDTCPVEQVSWDDAQAFIQKLNAKTGKQYRLPTEAEWVYACYGGSQTGYCGGNDLNSVAWYKDNSNGTTHPVGQKQANGYGLYDMSGNVWEWTSDCDGNCNRLVFRGGSWYEDLIYSRSARNIRSPAYREGNIGFRLARNAPFATGVVAETKGGNTATNQSSPDKTTVKSGKDSAGGHQPSLVLTTHSTATEDAANAKAAAEGKRMADADNKKQLAAAKKQADEEKAKADKEAKLKAEGHVVSSKFYASQLEENQAATWCQRKLPEFRASYTAGHNKLLSVGECTCKPTGAVSMSKQFSCEFSYTGREFTTNSK